MSCNNRCSAEQSEAFKLAIERVLAGDILESVQMSGGSKIGTLREKMLHAVCKSYVEPGIDAHEQKIGGFVVDAIGEKGVVEIQTSSMGRLSEKLQKLLEVTDVTVVHPVAHIKYLCSLQSDGSFSSFRKSPRTGNIYDAVTEILPIRGYLVHPRFHLRLLLVDVEEYRLPVKPKRFGRKNFHRLERVPVSLYADYTFDNLSDYRLFLGDILLRDCNFVHVGFTVAEFQKIINCSQDAAAKTLYLLRHLGVCEVESKRGRAFIYKVKN